MKINFNHMKQSIEFENYTDPEGFPSGGFVKGTFDGGWNSLRT